MKEEFLHYLFNQKSLGSDFTTTDDRNLRVLDFGTYNHNAGPDFLSAKIEIDGQEWAGHIEFHINASDWYKHGHQDDPNYNNVIAHFVLRNDRAVDSGGYVLPVVELEESIKDYNVEHYLELMKKKAWVPCMDQLAGVSDEAIDEQKRIALEHRLKRKSDRIRADLFNTNGDKRLTFYLALARAMGSKVNAEPFEQLAERTNYQLIQRFNDQKRTEAYLLGLSGLLPEQSNNEYICGLIAEFEFLRHKYELRKMTGNEWKYSRMRPFSFPDVRIAQFAAILNQGLSIEELCSLETTDEHLYQLFDVQLNIFWKTHFRLITETEQKTSGLSVNFKDLLIINAVLPLIYAVAVSEDRKNLIDKVLKHYRQLRVEKNNTIRQWKRIGLTADSAFDSQALLEQKAQFCNEKKCLFCTIGNEVLFT